METFSALLAICAGKSPASGEFPAQRPVTWSFDVFFDLCLNKRLRKQSWGWWFESLAHPLWRHCNVRDWNLRISKSKLTKKITILHKRGFDISYKMTLLLLNLFYAAFLCKYLTVAVVFTLTVCMLFLSDKTLVTNASYNPLHVRFSLFYHLGKYKTIVFPCMISINLAVMIRLPFRTVTSCAPACVACCVDGVHPQDTEAAFIRGVSQGRCH